MQKYKVEFYYNASGMEGNADSRPLKIVEAKNRDEAIYKYSKEVFGEGCYKSFEDFMKEEEYIREWGITCEIIKTK